MQTNHFQNEKKKGMQIKTFIWWWGEWEKEKEGALRKNEDEKKQLMSRPERNTQCYLVSTYTQTNIMAITNQA